MIELEDGKSRDWQKKKKKHMSDGIERRHFLVRILESRKCG